MKLSKGLQALTTTDEQQEIHATHRLFTQEFKEKNHNPNCSVVHPRVLFAFWQSDFKGGKIPYWHVMNDCASKHSTLSMQGLREWRVIQ